MSPYTRVMHTLVRDASMDTPETARRREARLWLVGEIGEARRRRRRELVRRAWSALTMARRDRRADFIEALDLQEVVE